MAKTESTAVTEFINSVRRQPVDGYGTSREMSIRNGPPQSAANPAVGTPAPE
ncbi:MAG TPA: hypothetical protein VML75_28540 [Kofleriaceae bacterium]|nr:hypothetical protein [Kofleriaceae bacterium]